VRLDCYCCCYGSLSSPSSPYPSLIWTRGVNRFDVGYPPFRVPASAPPPSLVRLFPFYLRLLPSFGRRPSTLCSGVQIRIVPLNGFLTNPWSSPPPSYFLFGPPVAPHRVLLRDFSRFFDFRFFGFGPLFPLYPFTSSQRSWQSHPIFYYPGFNPAQSTEVPGPIPGPFFPPTRIWWPLPRLADR